MTTPSDNSPPIERSNPIADLYRMELPVELEAAPTSVRQWPWLLLASVAGLLVVAQSLYLSQQFWLQQPLVRSVLTPALDRIGYTLNRPILPSAWEVTGLNLSAEPSSATVWHLDAVLSNRARILQPWPTLQVSLRDWQNSLVGRRDIAAADYLPAGLSPKFAPSALIASDQPVRIRVSVALEPGADGRYPVFEQAELKALP
ncbi:MAG: DUF3426 domain-containing protein [Paraperlucidibaca sp.]